MWPQKEEWERSGELFQNPITEQHDCNLKLPVTFLWHSTCLVDRFDFYFYFIFWAGERFAWRQWWYRTGAKRESLPVARASVPARVFEACRETEHAEAFQVQTRHLCSGKIKGKHCGSQPRVNSSRDWLFASIGGWRRIINVSKFWGYKMVLLSLLC